MAAFPAEGLAFLRALEANNDRAWFEANRAVFEGRVRAPMLAVVHAIERRLDAFAPGFAGSLARIHRDLRFSGDKSPYKTQMTAVFAREGRGRGESAVFRLRVHGAGAEVAGGLVTPGGAQLRRLREALAEEHPFVRELVAGLRASMGELRGELLQRVPKGFRADHPAGDLLRRRQLFFAVDLPAERVTGDRFVDDVAQRFEALAPLARWIDHELGSRALAA